MSQNNKLFTEFPPVSTEQWEAAINEDLKGADYDKKLVWHTLEGFNVKPYYRSEDLKDIPFINSLPGSYPFVRGNETDNNRWEIRQDIDSTDAAEANRIALDAISRGAEGIGFRMKEITTPEALQTLLSGINLTQTKIHFISSRSYPALLDLFINYLAENDIDPEKVHGSLNFDPINFLALHGKYYTTKENNLVEMVYVLNTIEKKLPGFKAIAINGHTFANAGSSLVQELAFSLSSATDYLAEMTAKGITIDNVAPKIQFSFSVGSNYFMEIAKFRAARLLWAKIVEQFKPKQSQSLKMFIHATTLNWDKTLYDAHVNLLRSTTEAMSAIIGGVDSLNVVPFDVCYKDSDDISRRLARNQQIILKEESYLDKIVDPAAGSYYLENLTQNIASAAWTLFKLVEEKGGFTEAFKTGFIQDEIEKIRKKKDKEIANRRAPILGTNQYPNQNEEGLKKIQMEDDETEADTQKPTAYRKLEIYRAADAFEDLRLLTEMSVEAGNPRPKVFLFTMGNLAMRKARAGFASNLFGVAGYQIIDNPGFETVDDGVDAAQKSGAEIVVICSSDEEYPELAPAIAKSIKETDPDKIIILAGYPKEIIDSLKAAGVDDFIHIRTNALEFLKQIQEKLGIIE